jgi:hypothetical protein
LVAVATNKLLGKIKSGTVNLGVTAVERGKTAGTVAEGIGRLGRTMMHLRRGNFGAAAEAVGGIASRRARKRFSKAYAKDVEKAVASGWLNLKYGWYPIVNDIYGSCDALARRGLSPMYVTKTHTEKYVQPLRYSAKQETNGDAISRQAHEGERTTIVKISCTYYRPSSGVKSLSEVGITNPALVAWELVPYSFVVDWALPIGAWLDTMDATLGLTFYSGYRTEFVRRNLVYTHSQQGVDAYGKLQDMFKQGSSEYVSCERYPLTGFPSPALPRFRNPASISNLASAMALFSSIFRK